jgi:tryptophan-rich sensory protein
MSIRFNYLIIPLLAVIAASAAAYFAETGRILNNTIVLPMWTPPISFTGNILTIIFLINAVSVLIIWNKYSEQKNFKLIIGLFILSAVINVGWNIMFFVQQEIALAFLQSVFLITNIALLIVLIWKFCPLAASCLLPYSLWVLFSNVLTFNVWILN